MSQARHLTAGDAEEEQVEKSKETTSFEQKIKIRGLYKRNLIYWVSFADDTGKTIRMSTKTKDFARAIFIAEKMKYENKHKTYDDLHQKEKRKGNKHLILNERQVYCFINLDDDIVKIGVANDAMTRFLKAKTMSHRKWEVKYIVPGNKNQENTMHSLLAPYRCVGTRELYSNGQHIINAFIAVFGSDFESLNEIKKRATMEILECIHKKIASSSDAGTPNLSARGQAG